MLYHYGRQNHKPCTLGLWHRFERNYIPPWCRIKLRFGESDFSCRESIFTILSLSTVEVLWADTHKQTQLYLRLPWQNPVWTLAHTNSVFTHSRTVEDTFSASRGCPLKMELLQYNYTVEQLLFPSAQWLIDCLQYNIIFSLFIHLGIPNKEKHEKL